MQFGYLRTNTKHVNLTFKFDNVSDFALILKVNNTI